MRVALGATPEAIRRFALAEGARLSLAGVLIALLASFWIQAAVRALLFDGPVAPIPWSLLSLSVVGIIGPLTSLLAAREIDIPDALRSLSGDR
jgi:ABC-type antimicrobial peptide transport system permease subunit